MKKNKVAFFLGSFNRGGTETLLSDVFRQGFNLPFDAVCIYRKEGNLSETFHNSQIPLKRIYCKKYHWFGYLWQIRCYLLHEGVDIIHTQTSLNAIIAILCTMFTDIKVVHTFHGFGFSTSKKIYRKLVFLKSDFLIFVSNYEKRYYIEQGNVVDENKSAVVYNGIDFEKFPYLKMGNVKQDLIKLCMVGNFTSVRDQLFVCKCIKKIRDKGYPFQFYFIGGKDNSQPLLYDNCVNYCHEKNIEDVVSFLGMRNDVPQLLNEMDAFIYVSQHDTFGIAVIEAIAMGLPTIVNDWSVMKEITNNGQYAQIFKSGDENDCCTKIEAFFANREYFYSEAAINAKAVRMRYDIGAYINNLQRIYDKVIHS